VGAMVSILAVLAVVALETPRADDPADWRLPLTSSDVVFLKGADEAVHHPKFTDHDLAGQKVVVMCRVKSDGSLTECAALQESEFAPDAVKMAATVRIGPKAHDGSGTSGRLIQLTFDFRPEAR
jgi:hypothetical protein